MYPTGSTLSGTVILEVTVEKTGEVGMIQVLRGIPKLTEEAEHSLRQWKFEPARLEGQRVAAPVLVTFTFSLSSPPSSSPDLVPSGTENPSPYEPIRIISTVAANNPEPDVAFGTVILQVTVDPTGAVEKIEVIDGVSPLAGEAERSVRQWRFSAARFKGAPLTTPMVASFIFSDLPPDRCVRF
jgi:TonB family protein